MIMENNEIEIKEELRKEGGRKKILEESWRISKKRAREIKETIQMIMKCFLI